MLCGGCSDKQPESLASPHTRRVVARRGARLSSRLSRAPSFVYPLSRCKAGAVPSSCYTLVSEAARALCFKLTAFHFHTTRPPLSSPNLPPVHACNTLRRTQAGCLRGCLCVTRRHRAWLAAATDAGRDGTALWAGSRTHACSGRHQQSGNSGAGRVCWWWTSYMQQPRHQNT